MNYSGYYEGFIVDYLAEAKKYLLLAKGLEYYVSLDKLDFDYTYIKDRIHEAVLQIEMAVEEMARHY